MPRKKSEPKLSEADLAEFRAWQASRHKELPEPPPPPPPPLARPAWLPSDGQPVARLRVLGMAGDGDMLDGGLAWQEMNGRSHYAKIEQELAPSEERAKALGFKLLGTYGGYTYFFRPD